MMPNITELLLIIIIVAIVFGIGKLGQFGSAAGKIGANFKKGLTDDPKDTDAPIDITPKTTSPFTAHDGPKPGTRKEPVEEAEIVDS